MPLDLPPTIQKPNAHGGVDRITFAIGAPGDRDGNGDSESATVWMNVSSSNADGSSRGSVSLGAWTADLLQAASIMAKAAE